MNDTVREELQTKIGRCPEPARMKALPRPVVKKAEPEPVPEPKIAPPPAPMKFKTTELANKKTSPTLVGFQPKKAMLPDWRLRLQNSIRQRRTDGSEIEAGGEAVFQKQLVTNGANALKAQFVEEAAPAMHQNPKVANALQRIEQSRKAFLPEKKSPRQPQKGASRNKNYPFDVVSPSGDIDPNRKKKASVNPSPKPVLVSSLRIEKKGYDTNKLPRLPQVAESIPAAVDVINHPASASVKLPAETESARRENFERRIDPVIEEVEMETHETEEIDDLAPISSRLTAGLFDMIIGAFATAIVLSPVFVYGGSLMSFPAAFGVIAVFGVVMFIYLTLTVGFRGRTFGMRLFSLEVIDADINEYPTLHQAAVSSAVFLLALPLPGIGFVPAFFNEEKRAAHDILSNTLVIREI